MVVRVDALEGVPVNIHECTSPWAFCGEPLGAAITASDGTFELTLIGCRPRASNDDVKYYAVIAYVDEGFSFGESFYQCPPPMTLPLGFSTSVEVTGMVYLDGVPATGWNVEIAGADVPCAYYDACLDALVVLTTALTDELGHFALSYTAEGFQCQSPLFFRTAPPDDWIGELPVATNPPATGWQRGCGSLPNLTFNWATSSE